MTPASHTYSDDLRPLLFQTSAWFEGLTEDSEDLWAAWRVTTSTEPAWWKELLNACASFARSRGLLQHYQRRFAGLSVGDLSDKAGKTRYTLGSLWEIANELVVGLFLERALGWTFEAHDPAGFRSRIGDWQFATADGRRVFVEVKSVHEAEMRGNQVFSRGIASKRLTRTLREAYKQLPADDRATLVILVGNGLTLSISHGIMYGDIFQTLFGQMAMTFQVMPYVKGSERIGPTFREMFAHAGKHRRLGCVAGLKIGGLDTPGLVVYAIHNPYANAAQRLSPDHFDGVRQFQVDERGMGRESDGIQPNEMWARICANDSDCGAG